QVPRRRLPRGPDREIDGRTPAHPRVGAGSGGRAGKSQLPLEARSRRGAAGKSRGARARNFLFPAASREDSRHRAAKPTPLLRPRRQRTRCFPGARNLPGERSPGRRCRDLGSDGPRVRECFAKDRSQASLRLVFHTRFTRRRARGLAAGAGVKSMWNELLVRTLPFVPKSPVRRFASGYVAGETLDEALDVAARLNAEKCMATLDVLGEDILDLSETEQTVLEYQRAVEEISERRLDSNISVKLTALGLKIDLGECRRQFSRIVESAREFGSFRGIEMEESSVTGEARASHDEAALNSEP